MAWLNKALPSGCATDCDLKKNLVCATKKNEKT